MAVESAPNHFKRTSIDVKAQVNRRRDSKQRGRAVGVHVRLGSSQSTLLQVRDRRDGKWWIDCTRSENDPNVTLLKSRCSVLAKDDAKIWRRGNSLCAVQYVLVRCNSTKRGNVRVVGTDLRRVSSKELQLGSKVNLWIWRLIALGDEAWDDCRSPKRWESHTTSLKR